MNNTHPFASPHSIIMVIVAIMVMIIIIQPLSLRSSSSSSSNTIHHTPPQRPDNPIIKIGDPSTLSSLPTMTTLGNLIITLMIQIQLEVLIDARSMLLREPVLARVVAIPEIVPLATVGEVEARRVVGRVRTAVVGPVETRWLVVGLVG